MSWAKVDDGWWCHPKVMGLPLAARGLWVSALSWSCAQRKSVVPPSFLAMVGATDDDAEALADAGLWIDLMGNGWEIHDWSEYQEQSLSEKRAEAGRKGGLSRGKGSKPEAKPKQSDSNAEATSQAGTQPVPSLPDLPTECEDYTDSTEPEPPRPVVDQPTLMRTIRLVADVQSRGGRDPGALAATIRVRLGADREDPERLRIEDELAAGKSPEDIAASWTTAAPDPLLGWSPGRPIAEPPRPPLTEFHGFDHDDAAPTDVARSAIAAARGRTEP